MTSLAWGYLVLAYFIASIPSGYLIVKLLKGVDIREHGSGNIGATNVKRVAGGKAAIATLAFDFLKGYVPVYVALQLFPLEDLTSFRLVAWLTALMCVLGHSKSIFLKFTGGKSVITSLGVFVALHPLAALVTAAVAVAIIKITRYVSVGSIAGAVGLPLAFWVFDHGPLADIIIASCVGAYVIYLHKTNIVRLMKHQENRL